MTGEELLLPALGSIASLVIMWKILYRRWKRERKAGYDGYETRSEMTNVVTRIYLHEPEDDK